MNTVIVDSDLIMCTQEEALYRVCRKQLKKCNRQIPHNLRDFCLNHSEQEVFAWFLEYTGRVDESTNLAHEWKSCYFKHDQMHSIKKKATKKFMKYCRKNVREVNLLSKPEYVGISKVAENYKINKVLTAPVVYTISDIRELLPKYDPGVVVVTSNLTTVLAAKKNGLYTVYCGHDTEIMKGIADRVYHSIKEVKVPKLISSSLKKERAKQGLEDCIV